MSDLQEQPAKLTYRPDVDGLRAVAVLLVVLNHLQTIFTGGYVGVDVFFVISGYLISSVILSEMQEGNFSIVRFYERRIRRIFPALFVMLGVVSLLAYRFLLPVETESFARSLLASVFSVSNVLFWREAGYFDAPSAFKPLLHTWSLAVEEQFYLFFPLLLVAVHRWLRHRLRSVIWTLAGASFFLACVCVLRAPTAAFFLAPFRAWELLLGTIVSQRYVPSINGKTQRNLASSLGLSFIVIPSLFYTAQTPFPGLLALPPCLGAALLIAAGETGSSWIGRVLAWRPVVFVGLISYSLYLCHWPIFVFRNRSLMLSDHEILDTRAKVEIFVVSMIVAAISWRYIEAPFRKRTVCSTRRSLFLVSGVTAAAVAAIALTMIETGGLTSRYSREAAQIAAFTAYHPAKEWREGTCFLIPENSFGDFSSGTCLRSDGERKNILLLGDSLAAHLYPGLIAVFPEINILQANAADCRPLLVRPPMDPVYERNCSRLSALIFGDYLLHHHVDAVLLAANWRDSLLPELGRTVAWIKEQGMVPIVVGPSIEYDTSLPRILSFAVQKNDYGTLARHGVAKSAKLDRKMADLALHQWKVRYISVFEDLCEEQVEMEAKAQTEISGCPVYAAPGVPLTFDEHHLTVGGSEVYAKVMRERNQLP